MRAIASAVAAPASLHDSSELGRGPINVVVDDHGVEALPGDRLLGVGPGQAALDRLRIVGGPGLEAAPLLLPGRRPHEDEQRLGDRLADGQGAVDVDLEQDVVAVGERSTTNWRGVPFRSP